MVRYRTVIEREGEDCGPIDWTHPMAADKPEHWRDAEKNPENYVWGEFGKPIIELRMYDGWPYWQPTPSVLFEGTLGPEWNNFNSYGACITRRRGK